DVSKAVSYYQKSCELNEGIGCYNLGLQYQKAEGAPQNTNLAKQYLRKSCDLADEASCRNYALIAENRNITRTVLPFQSFTKNVHKFLPLNDFGDPLGTIEFTRTTRDPVDIIENTIWVDRPLRLATKQTAYRDLKRV